MALGLTQLLTEMSIRGISWGKCGRWGGLTTVPPFFADGRKNFKNWRSEAWTGLIWLRIGTGGGLL